MRLKRLGLNLLMFSTTMVLSCASKNVAFVSLPSPVVPADLPFLAYANILSHNMCCATSYCALCSLTTQWQREYFTTASSGTERFIVASQELPEVEMSRKGHLTTRTE